MDEQLLKETHFERLEEFTSYLCERLEVVYGNNELPKYLSSMIAEDFAEESKREENFRERGLIVRRRRWVIRDDDLDILKAVCDGFKSAAAADFFLSKTSPVDSTAVLSALAGIGVSVVKLVRQVINKGATLSADGIVLISALKLHSSGASLEDLTFSLNYSSDKNQIPEGIITLNLQTVEKVKKWSEESVEAELKKLEKVAIKDGDVVALVNQDSDGKWFVSGV